MKLPGIESRTVVIGKTGSGKTRFAVWLLSRMELRAMPWIIINSKDDKFIAQIPYTKRLQLSSRIPKEPGVYVVNPLPGEDDELADFITRIWEQENCGIFVDEGYMLQKCKPFDWVLTQGRSKHIPVIVCTQRPVWLSRFVFSEAEYVSYFWLTDERDRKTLQSFVPFNVDKRLPPYHSTWYDVATEKVSLLSPCPTDEIVMRTFEQKLKPPEESKPSAPKATAAIKFL